MYALTYLTLLAGVASAVSVPEKRAACPRLQLIAAGGEGTVAPDLGYLQSTVDGIMAAIPEAELFQVSYPEGANSSVAIAAGIPIARNQVAAFAAQCPDSKMFLLGYSAGAAVIMDTICGDVDDGANALANEMRHHIIGEVVYGDPTYLPGKKYDAGTCTQGGADVPRVDPHACFPFGKKLKSYCDTNDNVCCGGDDVNVHFSYPSIYDADVAKFAKAKWDYYLRHNH